MHIILIVDDSKTSLLDLKYKLLKINPSYQLVLCGNYEDAVQELSKSSIDLAFIDLQMPVKNGADLIDYMKKTNPYQHIPIVILTGTGEDSLLKTSLEKMVNAYLHKPITFEILKDVVSEQLQ